MLLPNLLSNGFLSDNPVGIDISESINIESQDMELPLISSHNILTHKIVIQINLLVLLTFCTIVLI